MLQHLLDRQSAEQEVEVLSRELDSGSGRFSFAKAMFRDKVGLRSRRGSRAAGGSALSKGLGESMRLAGGLAAGVKLSDGHAAPVAMKDEYDSDDDNDLSLYRLAKSLAREFGPSLQDMLDQAIDIVEKVKKCVRPARSCCIKLTRTLTASSSIRLIPPFRKSSSS